MNILVVEDEQAVSSFIKKGLEENGHSAFQAFDGDSALQWLSSREFDLILLDIILPKRNGIDLCKTIRQELKLEQPIIMLTALGASDDIVLGLKSGADDYLTKPFKFKELLARIEALARRYGKNVVSNTLEVDDLKLDLDKKMVVRDGVEINLTAKEFNLLHYLLKNKGRVVSRVDILENVWDVSFDLGTNVIDVYMNYLRNKIDKPFKHKLIHTVIGMGYILKEE